MSGSESGYGILFRNVAASIEDSDPNAAQALYRAANDVEDMIVSARQIKLERDDFEQRLHAYQRGEL